MLGRFERGMHKAQMCAPQGDLLAGPAAAVARVAPDGHAVMGKLHADLMRAAGEELHADEREPVRLARLLPGEPRVLRAGRARWERPPERGMRIK